MHSSVVVIGSFMQDLAWCVDRFPAPGETRSGSFAPGPGGKGSNQAIASARAGGATLFMGAIGDDVFGNDVRQFYKREGVPAHWAFKKGEPSGSACILIDSSGQNEIVISPGANASLRFEDLDKKALSKAQVAVFQFESNLKTTARALAFAKKNGVVTILNPAPMRSDFPRTLLKSVDILVPNETEFMALLAVEGIPVPDNHKSPAHMKPEQLDQLCRKFKVPTVVVTLGKDGLFISQPSGWARLSACLVKAVDTSGAGDAFVGAFAAGLVRFQHDVIKAATFGNAAAALSVTKPGTSQSMPDLKQINAFLKRQKATPQSGARSS